MARTLAVIYNQLVAEKDSLSELSALLPTSGYNLSALLAEVVSSSQVAVWKLMLWVVAYGIYLHELIFDEHTAEVEAIEERLIPSTLKWYQQTALVFQYGDDLSEVATLYGTESFNRYSYATIDSAKQIVQRAAVTENLASGVIQVKVAKLNTTTLKPEQLATAEKSAFTAYIGLVKSAGDIIEVVSVPADKLQIYITVEYNPLVLTPTGQLITNTSVYPVQDAINNYIESLPFNGKLVLNKLIDAMQSASGVIDPVIVQASAQPDGEAYQLINREYQSKAGHLVIDTAYPLSTTISYI